MDNQYLSASAVFLIQALFGLYILAVMLRFLLQWVRADFYNPVSQFLIKVTNPVLVPVRRIIPGLGGIDLAAVVILIVLQLAELWLVHIAMGQQMGSVQSLLVTAIADLLNLVLNIFIVTIIIQAILSWVSPGGYNPLTALLYHLNEPVLGPARRVLPPVAGIDLSPLVVILGLQLLKILLVAPIHDISRSL